MNQSTPQPLTEAEKKELLELRERILGRNFFQMLAHVMNKSSDYQRMEVLEKKNAEYARYRHYQEMMKAQPLSKAEEKELENLIREVCPEVNEAESGWITIPMDDSDPRIMRIMELLDRQIMFEKKTRRQVAMN